MNNSFYNLCIIKDFVAFEVNWDEIKPYHDSHPDQFGAAALEAWAKDHQDEIEEDACGNIIAIRGMRVVHRPGINKFEVIS